VANTNDLATGLRRATDDVRSYYIIGFTPPRASFAAPANAARAQDLTEGEAGRFEGAHAKEFLWRERSRCRARAHHPAEALREAVMSPFATTEIPLKGTALAASRQRRHVRPRLPHLTRGH
jgi:hypothetical protein